MPPKRGGGAARGRPAFKPPRPANSAQTKHASGAATSRSLNTAEKKPAPGSSFRTAAKVISDSEDEDISRIESDTDELREDAPTRDQPASASATLHPIPAPLLHRLLHENFEGENTQIQKGAMNLVGKYMSIFVQEAIARARHERDKAVKEGGAMDSFLQVEDLEKLAPQLVLDF